MRHAESIPDEWVARLIEWARTHDRIERLFIFGSRARGDNKPDSDLDVAILLSGNDPSEVLAYGICMAKRWREEVHELLPVPIHLQFADPEHDEIVHPAILKDGRLIFSRDC